MIKKRIETGNSYITTRICCDHLEGSEYKKTPIPMRRRIKITNYMLDSSISITGKNSL